VATPVASRHTSAPAPAAIRIPSSIQPKTPNFLSGIFDLNDSHSPLQVLGPIGEHQVLDVGDGYDLAVFEFDYSLAMMGMK